MKKMLGSDYDFHTFSVGYGIQGDEYSKAEIVAKHIGSIHHEVTIRTSNILNDFDRIVWHMDEPTLNPAVIPLFYLAQEAKRHVKVVLVGDGADEVFAGYEKHVELLKSWDNKNLNPSLFFQQRMPFDFTMLHKLEIKVNLNFFKEWEQLLLSAKSKEDYLKIALKIDREEMLPNLQLMTVDRATMAQGLEARVPFLEPEMIRSVYSFGIENLIQNGIGKIPLRLFAHNLLPYSIYEGKKEIFFVPISHWMEQGMKDVSKDRIFKSRILPEILNTKKLLEEYNQINSYQLWCLLVVDSWYRTFFEN